MDQSLQGPTGGAPVDWRGLCEELADALACHYPGHVDDDELVNRVRAALAQPEPEVVGPTDGEPLPGPFSEHDLRQQWNQQADEFNQWDSLDSSEQLAWAQTRAIAADRARWGRPAPEPEVAGPTDGSGKEWQWYTYCPEEGIELYSDSQQAKSAAQSIMGSYEVAAHSDGWHEDMELVSWGMLVPVEHAQIVARGPADPGGEFDEWVRYELRASRPAPAPAGEVGELVEWLRGANWDRKRQTLATRAADLLEQHQVAPVPVALTEPIAAPVGGNYREAWDMSSKNGSLCFASAILSRLVGMDAADQADLQWLAAYLQANSTPQPVPVPVASDTRYEFSVYDEDYTEQAGGTAPTYAQALSEGQHYLAQYQQDGPHTLEVRRVEVLHPDALPVLPEGVQVIEPTKHTILVPAPVPVAVSERWPEGRDLGPDGAIWFRHTDKYGETHWLPDVLPLPGGEVE